MRRAVSAAYYSLFHLLIFEASRAFVKDDDIIGMMARSYGHIKMLEISKAFGRGGLPRRLNPIKATLTDPQRKAIFDKLGRVPGTLYAPGDQRSRRESRGISSGATGGLSTSVPGVEAHWWTSHQWHPVRSMNRGHHHKL